MEIVKVDHTENIGLLLAQFKDAPNLTGLLTVNNEQANEFMDALFEVRDLFWIDTAEGTQLDVIGSIINLARMGYNDTDYRARLKRNMTLQNFSGTPEEIKLAIFLVYGWNPEIFFNRYCPATYFLVADDDTPVDHSELEQYSPAGVLGLFAYPILQGEPEDLLLDANGNTIYCVSQANSYLAVTSEGDFLVTDDGSNIEFLS